MKLHNTILTSINIALLIINIIAYQNTEGEQRSAIPIFIHGDSIEIKSEIIEKDIDLSSVPSYCSPENYKIMKVGDNYFIMLPGGSVLDDKFESVVDAQRQINKDAKSSYERWIESNGMRF